MIISYLILHAFFPFFYFPVYYLDNSNWDTSTQSKKNETIRGKKKSVLFCYAIKIFARKILNI